jgi:hypothetical protein
MDGLPLTILTILLAFQLLSMAEAERREGQRTLDGINPSQYDSKKVVTVCKLKKAIPWSGQSSP